MQKYNWRKCILLFMFFPLFYAGVQGQTPQLVIPLGHSKNIRSMAVSPGSQLIATAGDDNKVIIWDAHAGKELQSFDVKQLVMQVLFTPDESKLIVVSGDNRLTAFQKATLSLWSTRTGQMEKKIPFEGSSYCSLSPDGNYLLIADYSASNSKDSSNMDDFMKNMHLKAIAGSRLAIYQLGTGKIIREFNVSGSQSKMIPVLRNGQLHYLGPPPYSILSQTAENKQGKLLLYEEDPAQKKSEQLKVVKEFTAGAPVRQFAVSRNGHYCAAYTTKKEILVWDIDKNQPATVLTNLDGDVREFSFTNDEKFLMASWVKKGEKFAGKWSLTDPGDKIQFGLPFKATSQVIAFSPDGQKLFGEYDMEAKGFDFNGNELITLKGHCVEVNSSTFSKSGLYLKTQKKGFMPGSDGSPQQDSAAWSELKKAMIISLRVADKNGEYGNKNRTDAQYDSMVNLLLKDSPKNPAKLALEARQRTRVWNLINGRAFNSVQDSVIFTADTVSASGNLITSISFGTSFDLLPAPFIMPIFQNAEDTSLKKLAEPKGILNQILKDGSALRRNNGMLTVLINKKTNDTLQLIALDSADWIITDRQGYYFSSRQASRLLHYVNKGEVVSFEQLDLIYNRPDIIIKKIGLADESLVALYNKAYQKRLAQSGMNLSQINKKLSVPQMQCINRDSLEYTTNKDRVSFHFSMADRNAVLDHYNIWVNEVPLFGKKGISLRKNETGNIGFLPVDIQLLPGRNKIEYAVVNANGISSYRQPVYIRYIAPSQPEREKVYFVGLGINRFADNTHPLNWCVSDIRELQAVLAGKLGNRLEMVDTLFDEKLTLENVLTLKKKLQKTKINDKVIIAYSGHGLLSGKFDYYLSGYHVDFSNPEKGGIPYEILEGLLDSIPARKKLLLLDACNSGEIDKEAGILSSGENGSKGGVTGVNKNKAGLQNSFELMKELFVNVTKGTGTMVIAAAQGYQAALEQNNLGHGVFTYQVLQALNSGQHLTISGLTQWVCNAVLKMTNGKQQPAVRNEPVENDWELW